MKASFSDLTSVQIKQAENNSTFYKIFFNKNSDKNRQEKEEFVPYDNNCMFSFSMKLFVKQQ